MATKQTTTAEDGAGPVDVAGTVLTTAGPEPSATFRAFTPLTAEGAGRYNVEFTMTAPGAGELVKRVRLMTGEMDKAGWTPAYGYAGPGQNGMHVAGRSDGPPMASGSGGPQVLATGQATGSDGPTGGQIGVASYIVKPEAGGKRRVEFWNPGREYPEIQAVKTPEQLTALMGDLPADADEHVIPVAVTWVRGKAKANGNGHYQDIVRVHRA